MCPFGGLRRRLPPFRHHRFLRRCAKVTAKATPCLLYTAGSGQADNSDLSTIMLERITFEVRLLGFDIGDWLMLVGGFMLAGLLMLLV
jgi:hypothetical protein